MYPFDFIVGNVPLNMLELTFYQHFASLRNASKPARFLIPI